MAGLKFKGFFGRPNMDWIQIDPLSACCPHCNTYFKVDLKPEESEEQEVKIKAEEASEKETSSQHAVVDFKVLKNEEEEEK
jgi:hypothetical protein